MIHFKGSLILMIFCTQAFFVVAQNSKESIQSNKVVAADMEVRQLHAKLIANSNDDVSRLQSFYTWIAMNIGYDVLQWKNPKPDPASQTSATVLKRKKAVCHGYAELFRQLCALSAIPCHLVSGYTRLDGDFTNDGHTWNVVWVNGGWKQVDVTWGAGFVDAGKFSKEFKSRYFLADPDSFLEEHYPFDPMWQLQEHPLTLAEFKKGATGSKIQNQNDRFAFADTISAWVMMDSIVQKISAAERMLRFAPGDPLSDYHLDFALIAAGNRAMDMQLTLMQRIPLIQSDESGYEKEMIAVLDSAAAYGSQADSWYRKATPSDRELITTLHDNRQSLAYNMDVIHKIRKSLEHHK